MDELSPKAKLMLVRCCQLLTQAIQLKDMLAEAELVTPLLDRIIADLNELISIAKYETEDEPTPVQRRHIATLHIELSNLATLAGLN